MKSITSKIVQDVAESNLIKATIILEGIHRYIDTILEDENRTIEEMKNNFINGHALVNTAKALKIELENDN